MTDEMVAEAVSRAKGKAITEASGGITLARVPEASRDWGSTSSRSGR